MLLQTLAHKIKLSNQFLIPGCDCSESFLTSGVPNLKLNCFAIQLYGSNLEVNSDSTDIAFSVSVICKPQQKARFSYAGVTNKQKLEQVVTKISTKSIKVQSNLVYHSKFSRGF